MKETVSLCDCEVIHGDVVDHVREHMTEDGELYDLADFFKMFGDSTRLKIMCALDLHEMCVCDLAVLLSMTKSAISHQLRSLKAANLVKFRRDGKVVYYSLADQHVCDIVERGLEHIREEDE